MKPLVKKIVCIGAGYVGGPTMAVIADRCPDIDVTVLDLNEARIAAWNSEDLPVYEPGLAEVVSRARGRNLRFVGQAEGAAYVAAADAVFISVNTPTKTEGEGAGKASDLRYVESCARFIAAHAKGHTIVIEKSTMPVRAADRIKSILASAGPGVTFDILSNPEFLAEGTAIRDLEQPDRVLIGGERPESIAALAEIYRRWVPAERILSTGLWSAELSKLVANAFLAQRVSSINSISALCEVTGADVEEVASVIGTDSRIGPKFLRASVGFGGSCFQKDLLSLIYISESYGLTEVAAYWQQVVDLNQWQKRRFADQIAAPIATAEGSLRGRRIAILGFAFKKDTNDVRETPAMDVCRRLLARGATLAVHDYRVTPESVRSELGAQGVEVAATPEAALAGADGVAVLTEWSAYATLDWARLAGRLKVGAVIHDGRNIVDATAVRRAGLTLRSIGKGGQSNT
ncbi:MAG: UDP-glucose 6-dehydrogenase [Verrucomicrobiota bacterium]|jgi:UDPglucose 6-dehydrogenase